MISSNDWSITNEEKDGQVCVHVHINDAIDLTNLEFLLKDEERKPIVKLNVNTREIYFCVSLARPIYAELVYKGGDLGSSSIKYVDGSGIELYKH